MDSEHLYFERLDACTLEARALEIMIRLGSLGLWRP